MSNRQWTHLGELLLMEESCSTEVGGTRNLQVMSPSSLNSPNQRRAEATEETSDVFWGTASCGVVRRCGNSNTPIGAPFDNR